MRVCDLVATKSHSQFALALTRMRQSLDTYGHNQPVLFYTDNMADKQFLEAAFPSLRTDVVPVEKYAHLEPLLLPDDVNVFVCDTVPAIDQAIATIFDDAVLEDAAGRDATEIVVGLDTEWNVDLLARSQRTGGRSRSRTAIIQIAYEKRVYIMRVCGLSCLMQPSRYSVNP